MNIINALPGITPTARPYSMGQWPQARRKMRNGRIVRWALATRPSGDTMELRWENLTYAEAEQLCSIWDANYGIYGTLTIPAQIRAGTSGGLNALLASPFAGAVWEFSGLPKVEAVKAKRCTVTMRIRATANKVYPT
jgi:hypothetical protein